MNNPLMPALPNAFPPTSRYYGVETAVLETADGSKTAYLRRRFIPQPDRFELLQEHFVREGERPDMVAALYMNDPEQFWRICDANNVMDPNELTNTPGQSIRITLPQGIPGMRNA